MTIYIYSTLACDNKYTLYNKTSISDKQIALEVDKEVTVRGGAGVMNKKLDTPEGILTEVTEEELLLLEQNPVFIQHVNNGFIKVDRREQKINKAVADMNQTDKSKQLNANDFKNKSTRPEDK